MAHITSKTATSDHDTHTGHQATLLRSAQEGDDAAWEILVAEYSGMLRATTRRYHLNDADAADAIQLTWLRLYENLDSLRQPERLAGWLVTTARRACLETSRGAERRESIRERSARTGSVESCNAWGDTDLPEQTTLRGLHVALVRQVLSELPERHQRLIRMLMAAPAPTYDAVAEQLGIPVGSIGPTRARILRTMRARLAALGLDDPVLA